MNMLGTDEEYMNIAPLHILIVDDNQLILNLFAPALSDAGYEVSVAKSGEEAIRKGAEGSIDIVLLDINLPDISGIEVMRHFVKTTSCIVILITGGDSTYSHETAVAHGAADFIVKPIRIPELTMRIQQAREMRHQAEIQERLVADLERLAIRDELTGLFNYRHFQGQLKSEVQRGVRYGRPLSLIIIDADHFKKINDTLGHTVGDRVLAELSAILSQTVRTTDTAFRYGGEEFVVLLPETPRNKAREVAERMCQAVEQAELLKDRSVTISAGVAEFCPTEPGETLLRRADSALYVAKREGRNRVAIA